MTKTFKPSLKIKTANYKPKDLRLSPDSVRIRGEIVKGTSAQPDSTILIDSLPAGSAINGIYPIPGGVGFDITYPKEGYKIKLIENT